MSVCKSDAYRRTPFWLPLSLPVFVLAVMPFSVVAEAPNAAVRSDELDSGASSFVVAIDATESMQYAVDSGFPSARLDLATMMAVEILDLVPVGTRCTVLVLQDDVSTIRPLEPLQAGDRSRTRRAMAALQPRGNGELRDLFLHVEQLLTASEAHKPASSDTGKNSGSQPRPFVVLITDGEDCRPGEAHGAAAKLKRQFPGLRCLLPGVCKGGNTAAQLQSLALAAAGDSPNLTSESGIAVALDSVREACNGIRNARSRRLLAVETALQLATAEQARVNAENKRLTVLQVDYEQNRETLREAQRQLSTANEKADTLKDSLDALTSRHETLVSTSETTRSELEEARVDVARLQAESDSRTVELEGLRKQLAGAEAAHADASAKLVVKETLQTQLNEQLQHEREQATTLASKANNVTIPVVSDLLMLFGLGGVGWVTLKKHAAGLLTSMGADLGKQEATIIQKQEDANLLREQERMARVEALQGTLHGLSQRIDGLAHRVEESIPSTIQSAAIESRTTADAIRADLADAKEALRSELAATASSLQGRLDHLNEVAESKLHFRFEAIATAQAAIEKLIEQVAEDMNSMSETQCRTLHQAIDTLAQTLAHYSNQTQGIVGALAEAEKEHALVVSSRLEAAQSVLSREVRDAAENTCSRLISHETASTGALREWFDHQADLFARDQLQSQHAAMQAQQERTVSALMDGLQKVETRIAQQISEFRNTADPGIERLREHLTEVRHLAEQFATLASQNSQQLLEKTTDVHNRLQLIEREVAYPHRESQRHTSGLLSTAEPHETSREADAVRASQTPSTVSTITNRVSAPAVPDSETRQRRIWERQLKFIPGLGSTSARRLIQIGINDIHELATISEGRLKELTNDFPKLRNWSGSAATIEQLCRVRLIDQAHAVSLLKRGISSVEQLAALGEDEIQAHSESLPQMRAWVASARLLAPRTQNGQQTLNDDSASPNCD